MYYEISNLFLTLFIGCFDLLLSKIHAYRIKIPAISYKRCLLKHLLFHGSIDFKKHNVGFIVFIIPRVIAFIIFIPFIIVIVPAVIIVFVIVVVMIALFIVIIVVIVIIIVTTTRFIVFVIMALLLILVRFVSDFFEGLTVKLDGASLFLI